jgi:hypothetical protein
MQLKRSKKYSVGKSIGPNTWVHKQYEGVFPKKFLLAAKKSIPKDFDYTVVKYNNKTNAVSFIQSPDFDTASEPLVGNVVRVCGSDVKSISVSKNPMIYHHKWLMVQDSYKGFQVEESKDRSAFWKSIVGVNREVSNRIGRRDYWLREVVPKLVSEDTKRSGKTAMSRRAISVPTRLLLSRECIVGSVLHHGCGKATEDSDALKKKATSYAEFDPTYAPDKSVLNRKYTTVISNYVMNTLPKEARACVWRDLARCSKGSVYVTTRQDKVSGKESKGGVITSKGTFQQRISKQEFIEEAESFFGSVEIFSKSGSLLMLRCKGQTPTTPCYEHKKSTEICS